MLPSTPMHELLLRILAELNNGDVPLVMTSGNISEEPIAIDDEEPVIYLLDADTLKIARSVRLDGVPEPGQIVRFSPDGAVVLVTSMRSGTATLIDSTFTRQTTLRVGKQPMDGAFRGSLLLIGCQGDGSIHVIDLAKRQVVTSFAAGVGCETLAFF